MISQLEGGDRLIGEIKKSLASFLTSCFLAHMLGLSRIKVEYYCPTHFKYIISNNLKDYLKPRNFGNVSRKRLTMYKKYKKVQNSKNNENV